MIRAFLRLTRHDQALVFRATFLVSLVRISLCLLPYRRVRRTLANPSVASGARVHYSRIAWGVSAVSRYIPGASCLTQALAAEYLLRSYGYDPELHIGVAKNESRHLEAHAWIDVEGRTILGSAGADRYTPLRARGGSS